MAEQKKANETKAEKKNFKTFARKGILLAIVIAAVIFLFKFPVDYFHISSLYETEATRLFSKSDALKVSAIAGLFFALYYRERIEKIKLIKQPAAITGILIFSGTIFTAAFYTLRYISNVAQTSFIPIYLGAAISLLAGISCFTLGVFGINYFKKLKNEFRTEFPATIIATVAAYNLMMLFQGQWVIFSKSATSMLGSLFSHFYQVSYNASTFYLKVDDFAVAIGAPCSGIESIILFAAFSIGIFALDHRRLKKTQYILTAIAGIAGIYFVNILRLFLLILTGIYISPEFAVGMFHTNVGWLLFVIYFLLYYWLVKRFIYKKEFPTGNKRHKSNKRKTK